MFYNNRRNRQHHAAALVIIALLGLLVSACTQQPTTQIQATQTTNSGTTTGAAPSFPHTPPPLRTPGFGNAGQVAPTVKVLASVDPTLIIQFPLVPSGIKGKFPNASGLVTVFQNPQANDFDVLTVNVEHMPPNVKFTVFLTEIAAKPFGHAEYVGDLITREDGTGEATFHLITLVAFAADARQANVTTSDESGDASGIQLEHLGMWFDGVNSARQVLDDPTIAGTPFDGGHTPLHAGPQAMTDGQTLPVI
ncbi:MAG TPA: hypothetical protein VKV37_11765 [Ktedonobacteraceae bacterium]|jgi:hypothetical protein|nr:hypothetical protein [Ktedonobacteraceae bacterium]